jgi:oligopeptide transport system substrate-binding protein
MFICANLWFPIFSLVCSAVFFSGCNELEKPKPEPFYSQTAPPLKQEFRWSNGKMPKSFDPALASAPPETDIIRAIFECLTEIEPKTLKPIAAIASDWKSSTDYKIWTFNLRRNAKWSNGENVTARDFVRAWTRLAKMEKKLSHFELLKNISGLQIYKIPTAADKSNVSLDKIAEKNSLILNDQSNTNSVGVQTETTNKPEEKGENKLLEKTKINHSPASNSVFGVEAIDNYTLKISLVNADKDFPAIVAHPLFSPIYGNGKNFESEKLNADIVTNGAFRIFSVGQDGITLDRSENYWNAKKVELERVRFVPTENAEKALQAYRAGEVDAVTNAEFEPLALKLLTPFDDFRRTTHSALNFYEFNRAESPFNDQRVREAMAISIERKLLTEGEMDDAAEPALGFLPFHTDLAVELSEDPDRARKLLSEAGFPNGKNFPKVRLLVNRNNIQQKVAKSVARMWKQNLNIDTEIIVKESGELEIAGENSEFDVIRHGVVLPTTNESVNMLKIFPPKKIREELGDENPKVKENELNSAIENEEKSSFKTQSADTTVANSSRPTGIEQNTEYLTADKAISEFPAIPLYFPISYSLVKPYIQGFEINILDAHSLKDVKIDNNWQPKKTDGETKKAS